MACLLIDAPPFDFLLERLPLLRTETSRAQRPPPLPLPLPPQEGGWGRAGPGRTANEAGGRASRSSCGARRARSAGAAAALRAGTCARAALSHSPCARTSSQRGRGPECTARSRRGGTRRARPGRRGGSGRPRRSRCRAASAPAAPSAARAAPALIEVRRKRERVSGPNVLCSAPNTTYVPNTPFGTKSCQGTPRLDRVSARTALLLLQHPTKPSFPRALEHRVPPRVLLRSSAAARSGRCGLHAVGDRLRVSLARRNAAGGAAHPVPLQPEDVAARAVGLELDAREALRLTDMVPVLPHGELQPREVPILDEEHAQHLPGAPRVTTPPTPPPPPPLSPPHHQHDHHHHARGALGARAAAPGWAAGEQDLGLAVEPPPPPVAHRALEEEREDPQRLSGGVELRVSVWGRV